MSKTNWPQPTPAQVTEYSLANDESIQDTARWGFGCLAWLGLVVIWLLLSASLLVTLGVL